MAIATSAPQPPRKPKMSEPDDKEIQVGLMGCGLMIVLFPFALLLRAFILTQLWAWFIVPFGIQQIGLAWAYGLSTTIAMFTPTPSSKKDEEGMGKTVLKFIGTAFIVPLLFWFIGWVCHQWM